jgi:hypothetical protein
VWTVYADNEGHGFAKKANRDYLTAVVVLFFGEALGHQPGIETDVPDILRRDNCGAGGAVTE